MQQLHLVGFTTDMESLIFSARKGAKSGSFTLPLDEQLLARIAEAVQMRNGRAGTVGVELELPEELRAAAAAAIESNATRPRSSLSPREIQARLRAGRTVEQVATEADVDPEWVARFSPPIEAEQRQVLARARSIPLATVRRGVSAQPLGVAVRWNLMDKGLRMTEAEFDSCWSAAHMREQEWLVTFRFTSRKRSQVANWELDLRDGSLTPRNRLATELGFVEAGRRRGRAEPLPPPAETQKRPAPAQAPRGAVQKRAAKAATISRTTGAKTAKSTKAVKATKPSKTLKTSKAAKAAKTSKTSKSSKTAKVAKAGKAVKKATKKKAPPARPAIPVAVVAVARPAVDELAQRRLELVGARSAPLSPRPVRRPSPPPVARPSAQQPPRVVPTPSPVDVAPTPAPAPESTRERTDREERAERAARRSLAQRRRVIGTGESGVGSAGASRPEPRPAAPAAPADPEVVPGLDVVPVPGDSGGERVVTIRADRAGPPGRNESDEGVTVTTRAALRPINPAAKPTRRRFGRNR